MLAHRLPRHVETRAQFVQRLAVLGPQPVEQLAAAGIGQCFKNIIGFEHLIHDNNMQPFGCLSSQMKSRAALPRRPAKSLDTNAFGYSHRAVVNVDASLRIRHAIEARLELAARDAILRRLGAVRQIWNNPSRAGKNGRRLLLRQAVNHRGAAADRRIVRRTRNWRRAAPSPKTLARQTHAGSVCRLLFAPGYLRQDSRFRLPLAIAYGSALYACYGPHDGARCRAPAP